MRIAIDAMGGDAGPSVIVDGALVAARHLQIGLLLVGAPAGQVNPPKWLGWVAIVAGLAMWLSLLILASDAGFVFFPINLIATQFDFQPAELLQIENEEERKAVKVAF